jgi:proteasome lid subunit RPN8/RPN11
MIRSQHRFAVEFFDEAGCGVCQQPLDPNWEPAVEWSRFEAMRHLPVDQWGTLERAAAEVIPVPAATAPYVNGFRVDISLPSPRRIGTDFPLTWFKRAVESAAAALVKAGKLTGGGRYSYRLLAFRNGQPLKPQPPAFSIEEFPLPPIPVRFDLGSFGEQHVSGGENAECVFPVFIPERVLKEAADQAQAVGAKETGGILLGHLLLDEQRHQLGVLVAAQIPALHTEAECESLVFTENTWAAAASAIALRGRRSEMWVGWWHSHPSRFWCKDCPPEKQRTCLLKQASWLSSHDLSLHESTCPKSFNLALLITHADEGVVRPALFSWHRGLVVRRTFALVRDPDKGVSEPERRLARLANGDTQTNH